MLNSGHLTLERAQTVYSQLTDTREIYFSLIPTKTVQ